MEEKIFAGLYVGVIGKVSKAGFGFIFELKRDDGEELAFPFGAGAKFTSVFIHPDNFMGKDKGRALEKNMTVAFSVVETSKGLNARYVMIVAEAPDAAPKTAPAKKPPQVIRNPDVVEETKPVPETLYTRTETDPEARHKGTEAVLETPSSETAWVEVFKPMLAGIVELLKMLAILAFDFVRWAWGLARWAYGNAKNFIADRRARKSAA